MAHPRIMDDPFAIAERADRTQDSRRGLVVAIVISGRDPLAMRGQQHVADGQHRQMAFAGNRAQFQPAIDSRGQIGGRMRGGQISRRGQRDEHPVDIGGVDRIGIGRDVPPDRQRGKGQHDVGILRRAGGIVPQPHEPATGRARRVASFDRQRRAIGGVKRQDPARTPMEAQDRARVIAVGFIGEQRMVERVGAVPDQPRQCVGLVEFGIDPQRIGAGRHHRSDGRAGEIDSPEARIEPLDPVAVLPVAPGGEPEGHGVSFR